MERVHKSYLHGPAGTGKKQKAAAAEAAAEAANTHKVRLVKGYQELSKHCHQDSILRPACVCFCSRRPLIALCRTARMLQSLLRKRAKVRPRILLPHCEASNETYIAQSAVCTLCSVSLLSCSCSSGSGAFLIHITC